MRERERYPLATIAAETMYNLLELEVQQEAPDLDAMMRRLKDLSAYSLTHTEIMDQREGIELLPISLHHSHWDHALEKSSPEGPYAIRLGFRLIKGVTEAGVQQIIERRREVGGWRSFERFVRDCPLPRDELTALAASGLFSAFGDTRSDALWKTEAAGYKPLLDPVDDKVADVQILSAEVFLPHVGEKLAKRGPVSLDIGKGDRLGVAAKLAPCQHFHRLFQCADAAGQRHERVGTIEHQLLAFVHVVGDD